MNDTQVRSESGPTWLINEPAPPYHEERFDTATPPLNPQQPTPEDMERELNELRAKVYDYKLRYEAAHAVAEAARAAVPDIETVFQHWGYAPTHPLPELRALLDMLSPPPPKWEPRKGGNF